MNKSQISRRSSWQLSEFHGGAHNWLQSIRIFTAALFTSFVVGQGSGCYLLLPAVAAEPGETEPVIKVVKPYASPDAESNKAEEQDVIDVLQIMGKAYASGDIPGYIKHLDDHCSVFDEEKNQMVEGKEAVIAALKEKFARHAQSGSEHIVSYTIDQPYVKINGEMAVVTYRAIEEVGGPHPRKLQGFMSDVFKKEDGHWMKVHQRAVWKRIK